MLFNQKLVLFLFFLSCFFHFPSYLSFNFLDFCLPSFALVNVERETMHCIIVLSCYHRNNQSSTYELFQIESTKVQPYQVWTLSGLRFLTGSWLIETVSYFVLGHAIFTIFSPQLIRQIILLTKYENTTRIFLQIFIIFVYYYLCPLKAL